MPSRQTLDRFIACVEANTHVKAVAEFYAEDCSIRENQAPARLGRVAQLEREQQLLSRVRKMTSSCVRPAMLDGDCVAIRWIFEFDWADGSSTRLEEVALQRWHGELIAEETFFYDPKQAVAAIPPRQV